jgi:hypothetical protein
VRGQRLLPRPECTPARCSAGPLHCSARHLPACTQNNQMRHRQASPSYKPLRGLFHGLTDLLEQLHADEGERRIHARLRRAIYADDEHRMGICNVCTSGTWVAVRCGVTCDVLCS